MTRIVYTGIDSILRRELRRAGQNEEFAPNVLQLMTSLEDGFDSSRDSG